MSNSKKELLTVKQYAQEAGLTVQAVYKQIKNVKSELYTYVVETDGKKFIKPEALKLINFKLEVEQNEPNDKSYDWNNLQEIINLLRAQIEIKDDQIKSLHKQNEQLTEALQNTTDSLKAAQALHAGTIQQQITTESESVVNEPEKKSWFSRVFRG